MFALTNLRRPWLVVFLIAAVVSPLWADDDKGHKRRKDVIELTYVEKPVVGIPPGLKAIAFIPFSQAVQDRDNILSPRERRNADEITWAIAQRLEECARQFEIPLAIVDREAVAAIMKEKDLADAGLAQEDKALKIGKLAKAQAICFGRMTIDVHKVEGTTSTLRPVPVPGRGIAIERQEVRQIRRTITVSATVKLISLATGKSIVTFNRRASETVDRKPGFFMGQDAQEIELQPEDITIERLFNQLVDEFVGQLVPRQVRIEVRIVEPKGKMAKTALKMMQTSDMEKAIELFRESLETKPDDHAALYDLGIAYEIVGRPDLALKSFEQAYRTKDKDLYLEASRRLREKMAAAKAEPVFEKSADPGKQPGPARKADDAGEPAGETLP